MAKITKTETYPLAAEKFYRVVTDYRSYPQFMDGVDDTRIIEETPEGARVEYSLNIVKQFNYQLQLAHDYPHRVSWELLSGDLFKNNSGYWEFQDLSEGKTRVTYGIAAEFKLFVPKIVVNKVIKHNLPKLFADVYRRARSCEMEGHGEEKRHEGKLLEALKKVASLGAGAAFMTEDAIKNLLLDLPLPKDMINGLLEQAKAQKREFTSSIKGELQNYLANINPTREIDKILSKYEIDVQAKLTFQRKKKGEGEQSGL